MNNYLLPSMIKQKRTMTYVNENTVAGLKGHRNVTMEIQVLAWKRDRNVTMENQVLAWKRDRNMTTDIRALAWEDTEV